MSQGLKYMGMGSLVKGKDAPAAGPSGQGGEPSNPPPARPRLASVSTWAGAFRPGGAGEASAQKPRKKDGGDEDDDRHIRFTISGVDQRMTKEDFIREVRKYDKRTRKEILDHSNASEAVKRIATKDKPADDSAQSSTRGAAKKTEQPAEHGASTLKPSAAQRTVSTPAPSRGREEQRRSSPSGSPSGTDSSPSDKGKGSSEGPTGAAASSRDEPETAVERRRRLAVLQGVGDEDDDNEVRETPAERRRREAALGMSSPGAADDDSDDDDTPRVPPSGGRRGIRFADQPSRG